ncbi:MAG TPA: hypothetical protein VGD37_05590, partial [Kofleriaceae bacterium]
MTAPHRLDQLVAQTRLTAIDFVYVHPDQTTLDVFFVVGPEAVTPTPLTADLALPRIHLDSLEPGQPVPQLTSLAWPTVEGRVVARLTASAPGGFAYYRLRIDDPRLDPFFADHGRFSFKAACPSPLDCA